MSLAGNLLQLCQAVRGEGVARLLKVFDVVNLLLLFAFGGANQLDIGKRVRIGFESVQGMALPVVEAVLP